MALENPNTIQNPVTWVVQEVKHASREIGSTRPEQYWSDVRPQGAALPLVRRIGLRDLRDALALGVDDFAANRTDVIFLCLIYPIAGLVLARLASGYGLLPLLFPLAAGFALIGPLAGVGLSEMSRRREQGETLRWQDAFGVLRAPSIGSIALLGALLVAIFVLWLIAAEAIFLATLGPQLPDTVGSFLTEVFATPAGWTLIAAGVGVGFLFALLVLVIGVVSFPLLLDHNVGIDLAVSTSVRAVARNPVVMGVWGLIVAGGLVIGSLPLLVGLAAVLPVLGHATWHLYRKLVVV